MSGFSLTGWPPLLVIIKHGDVQSGGRFDRQWCAEESWVSHGAGQMDGLLQRIYFYKEYQAKSPRLHSADFYPRKQEQELQRTYRQHFRF